MKVFAVSLVILFLFVLGNVCYAQSLDERHAEIFASAYYPQDDGLPSVPEFGLGYYFGITETVYSKIFGSGYKHRPRSSYNKYAKGGSDYYDMLTLNLGASLGFYSGYFRGMNPFLEGGVFFSGHKIGYRKENNKYIEEKELSPGAFVEAGIRIDPGTITMIKIRTSFQYRLIGSEVEKGGASFRLTLEF